MRVLSLCSGIGGLDLAAEMAGMEVIGQVEIDPFCQAVLAQHWPRVTRLSNIEEVQGDEFGTIDLIAAGFPCQPSSMAGKRLGSADPRNLWPQVSRLIRTISPRWVVLENVPGLLSVEAGRLFGTVLWNLAQSGYDAGWQVHSATDVGAPHLRERVFIVAYARRERQPGGRVSGRTAPLGEIFNDGPSGSSAVVHAERARRAGVENVATGNDEHGTAPRWQEGASWLGQSGQDMADPNHNRQPQSHRGISKERQRISNSGVGLADASGERLSLWERTAGERPQPPTARSAARQTQSGLGRVFDGLSSWLDRRWPARPSEAQHEWEPPRVTQERVANRGARLKALGNAVVPAQAASIFAAIMAAEQEGIIA